MAFLSDSFLEEYMTSMAASKRLTSRGAEKSKSLSREARRSIYEQQRCDELTYACMCGAVAISIQWLPASSHRYRPLSTRTRCLLLCAESHLTQTNVYVGMMNATLTERQSHTLLERFNVGLSRFHRHSSVDRGSFGLAFFV